MTATGNDNLGGLGLNSDEFYGGAQKGGLVAYIGASGPGYYKAPAGTPGYYAILDGPQMVNFQQSGELWFTINDDAVSGGWSDNVGSLTVSLSPVPEPTTIIAGALALLPFGVTALRSLRKRQLA